MRIFYFTKPIFIYNQLITEASFLILEKGHQYDFEKLKGKAVGSGRSLWKVEFET